MIERTLDPVRVNAVLEASYGNAMDSAALVDDLRNVCLLSEAGGALFAWRGPGIYEGHSFLTVRGRVAIGAGRDLMRHFFEQWHPAMVWGLTPANDRHVRWFNRQIGFTSHGMMPTPEGEAELFVMEGKCL